MGGAAFSIQEATFVWQGTRWRTALTTPIPDNLANVSATAAASSTRWIALRDYLFLDPAEIANAVGGSLGVEHAAEAATSAVYRGPANTSSQLIWPQSFPVGTPVTVQVVFDVDPSLPRGNLLKVSDVPNIRVRLD